MTSRLVLPAARPGILTGTILALARALGETAPLLLAGAILGTFSTSGSLNDLLTGPYTVLALRAGEGPRFLECATYRWKEHVGPAEDWALGYRERSEAEPWVRSDAVTRLGERVRAGGGGAHPRGRRGRAGGRLPLRRGEPVPRSRGAAHRRLPEHAVSERETTYVEALREAAEHELARDPSVICFGLHVDDPKAMQGTTRGLLAKFGPERVFGTPLAEDAMTGVAIGMALAGVRPIHVHIRMDFLMLAMNQLVNIAAKASYMYGGQVHVPIVVRAMIGKSWGQGAQHSQGLYPMFMQVPGLRVAAPTNAHDAKGCLVEAIREDDPVLMVEHRLLYPLLGPVPDAPYAVKPGRARVVAPGGDVTIVGISHALIDCLRASRYLEAAGVAAEVIDPIWLAPLDLDTIKGSAAKTGRLLVVDNGWTSYP